ncbi:hydroxymethylglutaryl-CoA lyase [Marinobacter zhejiangensis]|uniref:hydroxymethylglutaryl-CoA lyase n=1 Tax=Marinobacter zhejiangensis TaxID=488535 RepID=A0A1I4LUZ3_9GAMM|nr:hydroxymethylglutaryl-CoA lyase [Marinobacter zhejiangensis]SFL94898.1 hydroxymethylglutaryl-CoA lyase [Marinobacter zhejiangensis]
MSFPDQVTIVEMGPRDGLQNERGVLSVETRISLIDRLAACGLSRVESGAFVSPKWVPQMAGSAEVLAGIRKPKGVRFPVLVPNLKGLEQALEAGAEEIAVFGAASESFSQRNINCSVAESMDRFAGVLTAARSHGLRVRGYVSCVLGCPYDGEVAPEAVAEMAGALYDLGCYEISLGDTIGVGTPLRAAKMVDVVAKRVPVEALAAHFHDTYGQALANLYAVMQQGVSIIDSSVAGLGGCPYARGAAGNVATEDVLYLLQGLGIQTGVDLEALAQTGHWICQALGRQNQSRVGLAMADVGNY